ncbi:Ubiquitin carboxyl-terminal hydrolase isozyme L5 [Zancudomyces culisetae]|uniref:Ubiquitin carboxyl-terminal hydrolase n=1 Tax=Zancudomyces culisetae TaxID=1213189 RepID=A0A1R1PYJ3_ZANCU|nr:Ubiquitin carboxyl-terminal hydrolase isozyme L5 [Zancudomyces culisetae]|eukprot:OMH86011.1 Ubiquitin carboxyl-terminal hydrolase isozyme L5 [Zancudomyces culisetae]
MGVKDVQVEEIWSMDSDIKAHEDVYGLVFLFKWENTQENKDEKDQQQDETLQRKQKEDLNTTQGVFFAQQIVPNACATQAILSILLNNKAVDIGEQLGEFKAFTTDLPPDMRGLALSNSEMIKKVHNSFGKQHMLIQDDPSGDKDADSFHFVAYVPIKDSVYELDGLKPGPIFVDKINQPNDKTSWIDAAVEEIRRRMESFQGEEIRFNLMAVVKDKRVMYKEKIGQLEKQLESAQAENIDNADQSTPATLLIHQELDELKRELVYENEKFDTYHIENARRKHNFFPLAFNLLKAMASKGVLEEAMNKAKK